MTPLKENINLKKTNSLKTKEISKSERSACKRRGLRSMNALESLKKL
jgi:hypothetical protein